MRRRTSVPRLRRVDGPNMPKIRKAIPFLIAGGFLYVWLAILSSGSKTKFRANYEEETSNSIMKIQDKEESIDDSVSLDFQNLLYRPQGLPKAKKTKILSGLEVNAQTFAPMDGNSSSPFRVLANDAWVKGIELWKMIENGTIIPETGKKKVEDCHRNLSLAGSELVANTRLLKLPCGLQQGSYLSIVGRPLGSQFMIELLGLKTVDGEVPPKLFHFNPRLHGGFSGKPIIEQNTCFRQQWGRPLRCEGERSREFERTVDGQLKCEPWIHHRIKNTNESKPAGSFSGNIRKNDELVHQFPFAMDTIFALNITAGGEGYHVAVNGKHITSFPYRPGYSLEDATGLAVYGDIDVHHIFASSLPTTHRNFAPHMHLVKTDYFKAPPLPEEPINLFIGVISSGNHFAERMAVRKSWMQHKLLQSSKIVARFFLALDHKTEVNLEVKKEAEYFGDIVIVPYMDHYDLVVLKTLAICEFVIRTVRAKCIMKVDDDTFVRVDDVMNVASRVLNGSSIYIGRMNATPKPLRRGKWAVTYQEWPEEKYPPYAYGAGYLLSFDIANFIVSQFKNHKLKLFKMEDVSVGIWVGEFNKTASVWYVHSRSFCQFVCFKFCYTAHYRSPGQMICQWETLQRTGVFSCCNER